jgi:methylenetetrahydrofolate dehydrogenase (NADP+)/methenyltetrahydrofolate cyclohydrolase
MRSIHHQLDAETSQDELLDLVSALNADDEVDGILVQLPLPGALDQDPVIAAIGPAKDVDGLTAASAGLLAQGRPGLVPCTPQGVVELIRQAGTPIEGAEAVVLGRSILVGRPLAALLLNESATVTVCHSRTADLAAVCSRADILVAAVGVARLVGAEHVKPGATVIDVGMNTIDDAATVEAWFAPDSPRRAEFAKKGSLLVGDVDPRVASVAGALTPVPRGVGPLTIAMLMNNTVVAAEGRLA